MFFGLYHSLRALKVPVSLTEWLTLMEGLSKGLHHQSLADFYYLARSVLVKDVAYYDAFDLAFAHCFKGGELPAELFDKEAILEWLRAPHSQLILSPGEMKRMELLSQEDLLAELAERLRRQAEAQQGGQQPGTGGSSPFGAAGNCTGGVSFDPEGGGGRAGVVAVKRKYRNLRNDLTLDVRQIGVALKRLRELREEGRDAVLDLEGTIDTSCRNGGEIDLVFSRDRENQVRLLLLMDSGGSMEPYRRLSERLFSAAHGLNHFKDFRAFYFHNCVYENLYTDLRTDEFVPTSDVIRDYARNYRLVVVGDAAMAPYELASQNGSLERARSSTLQGIDWLRELARAFPRRAWLNPLSEQAWGHFETVLAVEGVFPMFPLTLDGITRAVRQLQ